MTKLVIGAFALLQLAGAQLCHAQSPDKRFFTILAVEPRGGANVAQEAFPSESLPSGGGYVMRPPDQSGRWEVSSYVWMPSQVTVREGDSVVLEFAGINGASHPTTIHGMDKAFTLRRGQVTRIEFVAGRAGVYPFICDAHGPSMRGELIVLPRQ